MSRRRPWTMARRASSSVCNGVSRLTHRAGHPDGGGTDDILAECIRHAAGIASDLDIDSAVLLKGGLDGLLELIIGANGRQAAERFSR